MFKHTSPHFRVHCHEFCHSPACPTGSRSRELHRSNPESTEDKLVDSLVAEYKQNDLKKKPPKLLACSVCRIAHYHSTECQKHHWQHGHKEDCRRWKAGLDEMQRRVEESQASKKPYTSTAPSGLLPQPATQSYDPLTSVPHGQTVNLSTRKENKIFHTLPESAQKTYELLMDVTGIKVILADILHRAQNGLPPRPSNFIYTFPIDFIASGSSY